MKKVIWIGMVVLAAVGGGTWYYLQKRSQTAQVMLEPLQPERRDILVRIQSTGVVEPENKVEILPPIAGRIDEIKVEEGEEIKRGQLIASMSSTQRAALLDIARGRSRGEREVLEKTYQPTPIFAPVDGRIIKRAIVPGQTVSTQSVLFEMSDRLVVRAQVDETDLAAVRIGMDAMISVDAYPGQSWQANVVRIAHQSRVLNNVNIYDVLLALQSPPETLRSGMTANVEFIRERRDQVISLPVWALGAVKDGKVMLKFRDSGEREFETGLSDGQFTEVIGLEESQTVMVQGMNMKDRESSGGSPFFPQGPSKGASKNGKTKQ